MKTKNKLAAGIMAAVLTMCGNVANAAPGDLDASFGTDGVVTTSIFSNNAQAHAIAHDSLGRLVVAGRILDDEMGTSILTLTRYLPDGTLDTTFGDAGIVTTTPPGGLNVYSQYYAIAVDSKDRIVAGGDVGIDTPRRLNSVFTLARYLPDGSQDAAFGENGMVETVVSPGETNSIVASISIDDHDRIVAVGYTYDGTNSAGVIARYTENGGLDHDFLRTGIVTLNDFGSYGLSDVAIDSAGRIVVVGADFNPDDSVMETFVSRFLEDGTVDTTFGADGSGAFSTEDMWGSAIAIDPTDRILLAAESNGDGTFELERLTSDGTPDASFGPDGNGIVTTEYTGLSNAEYQLALDSEGRIIAAGTFDWSMAAARFTSDGELDPDFGNSGIAFGTSSDTTNYFGTGITFDDKDHFTMCGWSTDGTSQNFVLTRFEN